MILALWLVVLGGLALWLAADHYLESLPREQRALQASVSAHKEKLSALAEQRKQFEASLNEAVAPIQKELDQWQTQAKTLRIKIDEHRKTATERLEQINEIREAIDELNGWWASVKAFFGKEDEQAEAITQKQTELDQLKALQEETKATIANLHTTLSEAKAKLEDAQQLKNDLLATRTAEIQLIADQEAYTKLSLKEDQAHLAQVQDRVQQRNRQFELAKMWLHEAWENIGIVLLFATFLILFGPLLWRATLYYLWAPLMERASPIRIPASGQGSITTEASQVAVEIALNPKETLILQPTYYQATDDDLVKKTRFLYNWRYPITSLASRLFELTEVTHTGEQGTRCVTLSSQDVAETELCRITLSNNSSLICRPSFIVGILQPKPDSLRMRSHWCFNRLHAWLTLQFRYFEFYGEGQLVLRGSRGIRAETLKPDLQRPNPVKITNQLATIGFTPGLAYSCRRAETFWAYFRGKNPLFDDKFSGEGTFLCQQISRMSDEMKERNFWQTFFSAIGKIIGL